MKRVQLIDITPEQLIELFDSIVVKRIKVLKKELINKHANEDLLNREQAAELLQINLSTLYHWTNAKKLTAYGISGRRYYKRNEIMDSLKLLKK